MKTTFFFEGKIDKFWSYRKARMTIGMQQVDIEGLNNDSITKLRQFIESNGYRFDNHICWKIGSVFYNYTDGHLYIGNNVCEGDY